MSVATHLGLADHGSEVLALARQRWPHWQLRHGALVAIDEMDDLPAWLRDADWYAADEVLLTLAQLSAPDGGDDVAATGVLTWVLLPGASLLAFRLSRLSRRIDEILAAQLWVEARTFPWQRGHKVAANILMNTRKGVMRDLGIGEAGDRTGTRTIPFPPTAEVWAEAAHCVHPGGPTAEQELDDILEVATTRGALTPDDGDLLLSLAHAADAANPARSGRGHAGLMAPAASDAVAAERGVSSRTVRRRAARSVHALRVVCGTQQRASA
ncbi:conserved hypothetical protein [Nostocoides japonicum T1-X7]|uniref:Uncharacterized protein n=1 Tax=Nostocoides japonicum T1-X7 TaxID=1194083 RepID=A0A077M2N5_9MICO|nr:hypothetical protein [Tetrasphaera japonica]CCH79302.1 conserved hypothetical protein [Tetrasphaera japonica T1-X7]CCH79403.1 conserved hypothetical protein [Tetrasphaera japonica T1-X7]